MSLLDNFEDDDDQPAQDWSLAEQAAQFAPPLWSPPVIQPEGVTPLPDDFPVLDPLETNARIARFKRIMTEHAICKTKDCVLDERQRLAEEVAEEAAEAIGGLRQCAVVLWAHGETLLSGVLAEAVDTLTHEILRPFFESAGLEVSDEADYEE